MISGNGNDRYLLVYYHPLKQKVKTKINQICSFTLQTYQ